MQTDIRMLLFGDNNDKNAAHELKFGCVRQSEHRSAVNVVNSYQDADNIVMMTRKEGEHRQEIA